MLHIVKQNQTNNINMVFDKQKKIKKYSKTKVQKLEQSIIIGLSFKYNCF